MSVGRLLRMEETLSRTSMAANLTGVSSSNSITTEDSPSRDVELTDFTPPRTDTASSMGWEIRVSTSSGPAPG